MARTLKTSDQAMVEVWLRDYLEVHCAHWFEGVGQPKDAAFIASHVRQHQLVARDWQELWQSAGDDVDDAHVFVQRDEQGQLLGLILVECDEDRYLKQPMGSIGWIAVAPSARGQGIGRSLMALAAQWFVQKSVCGVEVFVSHWNQSAIDLYERCDFHVGDLRMFNATSGEDRQTHG